MSKENISRIVRGAAQEADMQCKRLEKGLEWGCEWGSDLDDDAPLVALSDVNTKNKVSAERSLPGSKKAQHLATLADRIAQTNAIVVSQEVALAYQMDSGQYTEIANMDAFIESKLEKSTRDALSGKDIKELGAKILRSCDLQVDLNEFNADVLKINCTNSVLDLSRTEIETLEHDPARFFTYCINAKYVEPFEVCPTPVFDQFCQTSLDGSAEKRILLLQMLGYIFSDSNAGKCALFFKGAPDSGKSIFSEFIAKLLGDKGICHIPLHQLNSRFNKAELFGKKVNICGEIKGNKLPDISTFKMITGGDRMMGEKKGQNPFYFTPKCKLLFSGNTLPGTTETDATRAFANRIVILLFNKSIPKEEQDKQLLKKLLDERDAIFSAAVHALQELQSNNYRFQLPEESRRFIEEFSAAENTVVSFLSECCNMNPSGRVFNTDLLSAYKTYCVKNGLEEYSREKFYSMLDSNPGISRRKIRMGTENRHGRIGLALKHPASGTLEQPAEKSD